MHSKDQNAILEAIFAESTLGIILTNRNGKIIKLNKEAERLFAYAPQELEGQPIEVLVPDNARKQHLGHRNSYHKKPERRLMGEGRELFGKKKDGTLFPIEISLTTAIIEGEQVAIAYINDIAERLKIANALKESEAQLTAIIDNASDGIISIEKSGAILSINQAAACIFGYQQEEVSGKNIKMLMPEPDHSQHDQYLDNYHTTGIRKIIRIGREVTGRKKDGTHFPLHLNVSEVAVKGGIIYTAMLRDLTEQKMAAEQMRRYALALERSNQELQNFAYVSSHDLQEPLRKIRAFGDRLQSKISDRLNEKELDYFNRMLNGAARMQKLIDDLLTFSRVNTQAKDFEKINLNNILKDVLSDLSIVIDKNKAHIEIGELPTIEADATQMWQLFKNLISNAIKFKKENQEPHIKIYAKKVQRQAHMSGTPGDLAYDIFVEDNGIGFDEKYQDKIFQIFQRLEGQKYKGSGIGLSICKRITNRHGGDLIAKSKPREGATFIATLSAKQTEKSNL